MVLVCEIHRMLQIALPVMKLHLSAKQLVLIFSVLLMPLINGIEPQVEAREMIIQVLIEVGSVESQGALPIVAPGQRESVLLLLKGNSTGTARKIITTLTIRTNTTRTGIATTSTSSPYVGAASSSDTRPMS